MEHTPHPPCALTIAGSDPSGGAGIQADLKTFHQHQVYGMSVVTLLTVQNTRGVNQVSYIDPELVQQQIRAVLDDIPPHAVKTGALGSAGIIEAAAAALDKLSIPIVVDPVMISTHGALLLEPDAVEALTTKLLPITTLLTPNIPEAEALSGKPIATHEDAALAAKTIRQNGVENILIKGGHRTDDATDLLFAGDAVIPLEAPHIETKNTHGTGCSYAAAITANLAKGLDLEQAVRSAKRFISEAIRTAPSLGGGNGPINHFVSVD